MTDRTRWVQSGAHGWLAATLLLLAASSPREAAALRTGVEFTIAGAVASTTSDTIVPGRPAIATDGTNYLVVSCRSTGLFGVIVSPTGSPIQTFDIASHGCSFPNPALAFDGTNYLLVFGRDDGVFGARVSPAGASLDGPEGFPISSGPSNHSVAVAFGGPSYLVVWGKYDGDDWNIYGATVSPGGQVSPEFPVFEAPGEQIFPAVAFDGTNFLAVWGDTRNGSGPDIVGTRVTPSGVVLDPAGISISTAPGVQAAPSITFGAGHYLVVWPDGRNGGNFHIFGARVSPDGSLVDGPASTGGIPISTADVSFPKFSPAASFTGSDYLVAWAVEAFPHTPSAGIFVARVSASGTLLDGTADSPGLRVSVPCPSCRLLSPAVHSIGGRSLVGWLVNSEMQGRTKSIEGALVPVDLLYDSGPLVNRPGAGFGGADASRLQTSLGMDLLGFGVQVGTGFRVADDFSVAAPGATLTQITFFAYHVDSGTNSTINDARLRIWNGPPNDSASVVVWGDPSTNVLARSTFSGIYRDSEASPGIGRRPIMANVVRVDAFLGPGAYWLEWQVGGLPLPDRGPFAPPITLDGFTTTGNALSTNSMGAWGQAADAGAGTPQGFPFVIEGLGSLSGIFFDVLPSHFALAWIEALSGAGVTAGCGTAPRRYCPEAGVTRQEMAVFLLRAREGPTYSPPACTVAPFADVPCANPFAAWIAELVRRGITAGCGAGNYCPGAPVTREQMAVFLLRTVAPDLAPPGCVVSTFTDVPCSSLFASWVEELVRRGITAGCGAGLYCPGSPVTRAQMAVFLIRTFNLPM